MPSPADRFTRMQKLAIFLIALGQERTREVLEDVDLDTVEHLNAAIRGLGPVSAEEKASVMLEFAQFFYGNQTITGLAQEPPPPAAGPAPPADLPPADPAPAGTPPADSPRADSPQRGDGRRRRPREPKDPAPGSDDVGRGKRAAEPDWVLPAGEEEQEKGEEQGRDQSDEERAILSTLEQLRQRLDPGQIDWGRAGYDFGDGFKGPDQTRR